MPERSASGTSSGRPVAAPRASSIARPIRFPAGPSSRGQSSRAPSRSVRVGSRTSAERSTPVRVPRPSQLGHQPIGLLKENCRGSSGLKPRPQSGQASRRLSTSTGQSGSSSGLPSWPSIARATSSVPPPASNAASTLWASRLRLAGSAVTRSITISSRLFRLRSSAGFSSSRTVRPSMRMRTWPAACSDANSDSGACPTLSSIGARIRSFVPSGCERIFSTV